MQGPGTAFHRTVRLAPIVVLTACAGLAIAQAPHTHEHAFDDADKGTEVFDDPKRDGWQKPHEVIQALALKPEAVVVAIRARTSDFSPLLSPMPAHGRGLAVR